MHGGELAGRLHAHSTVLATEECSKKLQETFARNQSAPVGDLVGHCKDWLAILLKRAIVKTFDNTNEEVNVAPYHLEVINILPNRTVKSSLGNSELLHFHLVLEQACAPVGQLFEKLLPNPGLRKDAQQTRLVCYLCMFKRQPE